MSTNFNISLSNDMENILKAKVANGIFKTMEDAVTFALQVVFIENEIPVKRIEKLNDEIEKGWKEMENSEGRESNDVFQDLRRRYA